MEPHSTPGEAARSDGLTRLRAMMAGELPVPMFGVLDHRLVEAEEGRVVFRIAPRRDFYNSQGVIHGGWTAAILDSALGCAVLSTLSAGEAHTTIEYKVGLTRAIREETGECLCEGRVIHRGRRIATSEAWLRDASGRLLAHGTETCFIFPREDG